MNNSIFDYIKSYFKKYFNKNYVIEHKALFLKGGVLIIFLIAATFIFIGKSDEDKTLEQVEKLSEEQMTDDDENWMEEYQTDDVYVDIGGEVKNPMLLQLPSGSRIDDAIKAAGGLTDNADLSNVNRAQLLEDGQKILIPTLGDSASAEEAQKISDAQKDVKVNINTANDDELRTLDGVGPATAEKIINHREKNGRFKSIEDIMDVSGIGEKTFERLKDDICV